MKFIFSKAYNEHVKIQFEQDLTIPTSDKHDDILKTLQINHCIPNFALKDVSSKLAHEVQEAELEFYDTFYDECFKNLDPESFAESIKNVYGENFVKLDGAVVESPIEKFARAYSALLNSSLAIDLIGAEEKICHDISIRLEELTLRSDELIESRDRQTDEILKMGAIDVNEFVTKIHEESSARYLQFEREKDAEIDAKRAHLTNAFRQLVLQSIHEPIETTKQKISVLQLDRSKWHKQDYNPSQSGSWSDAFTVQLGRELKISCNIRLIQSNAFHDELGSTCSRKVASELVQHYSKYNFLPERMRNAVNIYSNSLVGLVRLVDSRSVGSNCILSSLCRTLPEFHFLDLERQLDEIRANVSQMRPERGDYPFESGDVLVTRHSNLIGLGRGLTSEVGGINVVFHLVVDREELRRLHNDHRMPPRFSSALASVFRVCFKCNVKTLSMPLFASLSSHQGNRNAESIGKQAETVFKVVKGILMELAMWKGPVLDTLQMLIPEDVPKETCQEISALLGRCFKMSAPVRA